MEMVGRAYIYLQYLLIFLKIIYNLQALIIINKKIYVYKQFINWKKNTR